jgi:chaperone required for assembly of F1-ATPase
MGDVLATLTDLEMTTVSSVVTATGFLIVGLALMADVILPDTAAEISILDEVYCLTSAPMEQIRGIA